MSMNALNQVPEVFPCEDFLVTAYSIIKEPLSLVGESQDWFRSLYANSAQNSFGARLLLGATPWLSELLRRERKPSFVIDQSNAMLGLASRRPWPDGAMRIVDGSQILLKGNWLAMPDLDQPLDFVVGDNSFSFLEFPRQWVELRDTLAKRMRPAAKLVARMWSVPGRHRAETVDDLARRFLALSDPVNYTEVRTALLFAHWNPATYAIETEQALRAFRSNVDAFRPLFHGAAGVSNDLETVYKYEGTGAIYYAPLLSEIIALFAERFHVESVNFGRYAMADYFPLIVASKV